MTLPDNWFKSFVSPNRQRLKPALRLIISDSFWPTSAGQGAPHALVKSMQMGGQVRAITHEPS